MGDVGAAVQLSKAMLARSRVIARGRGIRDVDRLVRQHGGRAKNWVKKSSPMLTYQGWQCEVHWYEHPGIGRVEKRIKFLRPL